jgi:hypothetical protein
VTATMTTGPVGSEYPDGRLKILVSLVPSAAARLRPEGPPAARRLGRQPAKRGQ